MRMKSFSEVCKESNNKIFIPGIQRGYMLGGDAEAIERILKEIKGNIKSNTKMSFSTLLVHKMASGNYLVYDGQQRITTIVALLCYAQYKNGKKERYDLLLEYTESPRSAMKSMLENLCEGKSIKEILPEDVSSQSILELFNTLETEELEWTKIEKFLLMCVEFNIVEKKELSDMEQYFVDLNDGVALDKFQLFKASLVNHIITNLKEDNDITRFWIYGIDNELQHYMDKYDKNTTKRAYEKSFYLLLSCYAIRHGHILASISDLTIKDLDEAMNVVINYAKYEEKHKILKSEQIYELSPYMVKNINMNLGMSYKIEKWSRKAVEIGVIEAFNNNNPNVLETARWYLGEMNPIEVLSNLKTYTPNDSYLNEDKECIKRYIFPKVSYSIGNLFESSTRVSRALCGYSKNEYEKYNKFLIKCFNILIDEGIESLRKNLKGLNDDIFIKELEVSLNKEYDIPSVRKAKQIFGASYFEGSIVENDFRGAYKIIRDNKIPILSSIYNSYIYYSKGRDSKEYKNGVGRMYYTDLVSIVDGMDSGVYHKNLLDMLLVASSASRFGGSYFSNINNCSFNNDCWEYPERYTRGSGFKNKDLNYIGKNFSIKKNEDDILDIYSWGTKVEFGNLFLVGIYLLEPDKQYFYSDSFLNISGEKITKFYEVDDSVMKNNNIKKIAEFIKK